MSPRFHIEDLEFQDASGVVFRATDSGTGAAVSLRRFFPFGPDGGGLSEEERTDFEEAISQLKDFHHPGLRATLGGGCDPADGLPYIVTEWLPGTALADYPVPLAEDVAAGVLARALEICEKLSASFDHDAVWIDTRLRSIVATDGPAGRGVTFWISPLKCLGKHSEGRGLEPLATLAEDLMGWRGRSYHAATHHGLAAWIPWLRGAGRTANLHEAGEHLRNFLKSPPPRATQPAVRPSMPVKKKKKSILPAILSAIFALGGIAGGGWWLHRRDAGLRAKADAPLDIPTAVRQVTATRVANASSASPPIPSVPGEKPEDRANRLAREFSRQAAETSAAEKASDAARQVEIDSRGGVFGPADRELLMAQAKKPVVLEGVLAEIAHSSTRSTMYLIFSNSTTDPRGAIRIKSAPADLTEASLLALKGKKVRISGIVGVDRLPKPGRPVIRIANRQAITLAE